MYINVYCNYLNNYLINELIFPNNKYNIYLNKNNKIGLTYLYIFNFRHLMKIIYSLYWKN